MTEPSTESEKARFDFLIAMYNQLMADINRHIVVIWQSVGVLFGAFAAMSLVEKNIISIDYATTVIIAVCIWVIAHVVEASYWYNRNLVIIANIERIFLVDTDLRDVHYYFGQHRKKGAMITHLRIQLYLALGMSLIVLLMHFSSAIYPVLCKRVDFKPENALPWIAVIVGLVIWRRMKIYTEDKYAEFLRNSPGKLVDVKGVNYGGPGHPTEPQ